MITIDQLLESVDLDFEPRYITKDKDGDVYIWANKPKLSEYGSDIWVCTGCHAEFEKLKLSEFDGKDWTECIYEVPRKTTGKIERFTQEDFACVFDTENYHRNVLDSRAFNKLNTLVDAVNELKGK
jgi:hypothetical protein